MSVQNSRYVLSHVFALSLLFLGGCAHSIHVAPVAPSVSTSPIDHALQVQVPLLALQGADRMPGVIMLVWPVKDLRQAVLEYARQRRTFTEVLDEHGDFTLTVRTWLWLRSREAYRYIVHLEADLGPTGQPPIKSYVVEEETVGSRIRWVTASDQAPIAAAVQAVLDELFDHIEQDAALFRKK
ncbi:MAG TPA: hypothetical protein VFR82_06415 [Nitrospira sp.]|nr:hypothetical protein [Nitrospira sp.]